MNEILTCVIIHLFYIPRGADKSLARPGMKQTTATKLLTSASHSKTIQKAVRPTRSPRQQWPPRRTKNGDLSIVFFSRVGLRTYQHPCTTLSCKLSEEVRNVLKSYLIICKIVHLIHLFYIPRGADKSLARPGMKQATATKLLTFASHSKTIQKAVRPTRSPRQQWPPRRTKNGDLSIVFFQSGRAKDLSAPLYNSFV